MFGPAHTTLPVHGFFIGTIQQEEKATEQEIFVVIGARQALLGRLAIESLKLVKKVNAVNADNVYKENFPKLFPGLGRLDSLDCVIKLKPEAKPESPSPSPFKSKRRTSPDGTNAKLKNRQSGVLAWL